MVVREVSKGKLHASKQKTIRLHSQVYSLDGHILAHVSSYTANISILLLRNG